MAEERPSQGFSVIDTLGYLLLFSAFPVILFLARLVSPSGEGLGTHTGLGLPPCGFYTMFHKPCPSCGMTTCFSLIMHGEFIEAIKAQPAGVFLFLTTLFVWGTLPYYYFAKKKKLFNLLELPFLLPILIANIVVIMTVWIIRLAL